MLLTAKSALTVVNQVEMSRSCLMVLWLLKIVNIMVKTKESMLYSVNFFYFLAAIMIARNVFT